MAKKRAKPEVPAVGNDPAVVGLETKYGKLLADRRIASERLAYIEGELASLPDAIDAEARRLLGETAQAESGKRAELEAERDTVAKQEAALNRAMGMLSPTIDKARAAAAEKIGNNFNRDVIRPLTVEVGENMAALVESVAALSDAAEIGLKEKLPVAISEHGFREFIRELNAAAIRLREASAA